MREETAYSGASCHDVPNCRQQETAGCRDEERRSHHGVRGGLGRVMWKVGHHQIDAEEKAEGVCPDVDELVVPGEEASCDQASQTLSLIHI